MLMVIDDDRACARLSTRMFGDARLGTPRRRSFRCRGQGKARFI
jgi:hypothetical protein